MVSLLILDWRLRIGEGNTTRPLERGAESRVKSAGPVAWFNAERYALIDDREYESLFSHFPRNEWEDLGSRVGGGGICFLKTKDGIMGTIS